MLYDGCLKLDLLTDRHQGEELVLDLLNNSTNFVSVDRLCFVDPNTRQLTGSGSIDHSKNDDSGQS